jgi:hypothetical protein
VWFDLGDAAWPQANYLGRHYGMWWGVRWDVEVVVRSAKEWRREGAPSRFRYARANDKFVKGLRFVKRAGFRSPESERLLVAFVHDWMPGRRSLIGHLEHPPDPPSMLMLGTRPKDAGIRPMWAYQKRTHTVVLQGLIAKLDRPTQRGPGMPTP